jgi:hypothetical protein
MDNPDSLTLVSEKRLRELLKIERAAEALREGVAYSYHGCAAGDHNIYCELCRVIAKYDKDITNGEG